MAERMGCAYDVPGMFPDTSEEYVVIKDITKWKETVHMPRTEFTD